ncbi:hypothetical protein ACA29_01845 [Lederbergia galactosidilytica]|uniref:Uncharacterized protein n=1 Tax=Lederbergia galactosidilytica TaxID=217031 RepID=A0A0Q9YH93_9BACI|nr:hypothetical protein ACA29_01845 [Lederbergia galactosidilytica]
MKNLVNLLMFIISAFILSGTVFLVNGSLPQNALLLVGIILLIMLLAILTTSKLYPNHQIRLCFGICGIILILFIPCLTTLNNLQAPLDSTRFIHFLEIFILIPIPFYWSSYFRIPTLFY